MALDMFHPNEIAQALRWTLLGAAPLSLDTDGTARVTVSSNRLFAPGTAVRLVNNSGASEIFTVREQIGNQTLELDRAVTGAFPASEGARLEPAAEEKLKLQWIAQGRPELIPLPTSAQWPAVVIEPQTLKQPERAGTNRTYEQEYLCGVYYLRRAQEGEEANRELLDAVGLLFNRIMSDPYLGGTCWHAQVSSVDFRPQAEAALQARHPGLQVVRLEVLARRCEVWG